MWSIRFHLAVVLLIALITTSARGDVLNGDFSDLETPADATQDPFAGWTVDPALGAPPTNDGGAASFVIDGQVAIQLQQMFLLPPEAMTLSFDLEISTDGVLVPAGTPDSFQASLFATNPLQALLPARSSIGPAFLQVDAPDVITSKIDNPILTTFGDVTRVDLDVSSVAGQEVLLEFLLTDNPSNSDGLVTTVRIDNVTLSAVPEPSFFGLLASVAIVTMTKRRRRVRPRVC